MGYLNNYRASHQNRTNRICHTIGIPMIVASFAVALWNWKVGLALFALGWALQFVGHFYEGKPPAFFSNPLYLLVGPYWWLKKTFSKVK